MVVWAEKNWILFFAFDFCSSWGLNCFLGVGGKNQRGWSPVNTFDNSEAKNTTYFTYPRMTAAIGKKFFFIPFLLSTGSIRKICVFLTWIYYSFCIGWFSPTEWLGHAVKERSYMREREVIWGGERSYGAGRRGEPMLCVYTVH